MPCAIGRLKSAHKFCAVRLDADIMRDLGAIEETEIRCAELELPVFLQHMADSLSVLFQNTGVRFSCDFQVPEGNAV